MGLAAPSVRLSAFRENLVDNDGGRRSGVDAHRIVGNILFRCMQSHDQLPFARSSAKLVFRSFGKPPVQGVEIDVEDEDPSNKSIKRGKFLEPPQKKEIALR